MPDDLTPDDGTDEQETVTPQDDTQQPAADPEPETPQEPNPEEEPTAPTPEPPPAPTAPVVPPVEERYRQSTSEAMILHGQKKGLEETIKKLTSEDTPTEAELLTEYPEYKTYNAVTQKLMRDTLENKKRQIRLNFQLIEQEARGRLEADVKAVTRQAKYAALKGDEKFEEFVLQPKHQGVDIETLADAYLVRTGKIQPPDATSNAAPAASTPKPSSGIPRGSGGPRTPMKSKKITLEEARSLRETNYREYQRQLMAGNIESEI